MHWILDVSFKEDACRIYRENATENPAGIWHMTLNMVRTEPAKISFPTKQKCCLMGADFWGRILLAGLAAMAK